MSLMADVRVMEQQGWGSLRQVRVKDHGCELSEVVQHDKKVVQK